MADLKRNVRFEIERAGEMKCQDKKEILRWALDYARREFSVIPIRGPYYTFGDTEEQKADISKIPLLAWEEFQKRRATESEIIAWWGKWPKANIGIVTGEISGITDVDLDSERAIEFAKANNFPLTPLVKTAKGYHCYYKYKEGSRNFQKRDDLPDIDLRSEGGYVVVPPSVHYSGKSYKWVDGKGLDDLPFAELPEIILAKNTQDKTPLKKLYQGVPDGQRNDSLARLVGSWVNDGLNFDECLRMAYQWNNENNPPETNIKKIKRTVRSIFEKHHRELDKENEETKKLSEVITEATTQNLPEILKGLAKVKSESERAILIAAVSKRLNIGKRFIQNDIKNLNKTEDRLTVYSAHFPGLVDLGLDENGNVAFLIKDKDFLGVATIWEIDGLLYSPPGKAYLPFELPRASEVIKQYKSDNDRQLFEAILSYLKRFSYLSDKQWLIIAFKIFLTYIQDHPDIHYLPMILFYAVPERGKSRTGKAAIYISYRGVYCVDLREANLFRFAQDLKATLFIDIMDLWKKAERNGSEDILLLRYERGAKATRVIYPEKGAFKDMVYYDVYGSTFIATNQAIHKILDSRSIPITMPNKPGDYENPTSEKAQELKERLTAWRARAMDVSLPEIEHIGELNGRLWDISKPLLQVCKLVYPEGFNNLKDALFEVAGQRIEDKKASIEGQIVSALYDLSPEIESVFEWTVKTQEVLDLLNKNRPEAYKLSPQYLGKRLSAMGIKTRKVHGYSEVILKKADFTTLLIQYGIIEINDTPPPVETLPNSTILLNQGISTVYAGRELVESEGNSTQTLPTKNLDNKGFRGLVESGRELQGAGKKKFLKTLEVVE